MAGITRSLLTFSQGGDSVATRVVPSRVVEDTARLFRHSLPRSIDFVLDNNCDDSFWVMADSVQLQQVSPPPTTMTWSPTSNFSPRLT